MNKKTGVLTKIESLYEKYCQWYSSEKFKNSLNPREKWQRLIHQHPEGPSIVSTSINNFF